MDDYLESQCKEFDDTQIETDKTFVCKYNEKY